MKNKRCFTDSFTKYKELNINGVLICLQYSAIDEGQIISISNARIKKGVTTPPKRFTEDTLLCAMETAGVKEQERKGLGTPATRAGILERLVSNDFINRKKSKNIVQLILSHDEMMMCLYNTGSRNGLIESLKDMSTYLKSDETSLKQLTDSTLEKLYKMTDEEFDQLDLVPDFDIDI